MNYKSKFKSKPMVEGLTSVLVKTKAGRFVNSFTKMEEGRKGQCNPELCETLDGVKGSACCRLGFTCPFLCNTNCEIYTVRPRNCRVFPANKEDLKLVKNCGYSWD